MTGLCDLHCHLLHGLDDGAKTLDETLEMARALVDLGFSTIAPSPHNRPEYATREVALKRLADVQDELRAAEIPLLLAPNSENFLLDERFLSGLGTEEARLVGKGPFVLVEAPYSAPVPMLTEMIFRIKLKGITPLLAHPERCYEFERTGRAAEAVRAGACLQLDIGALIGRYGTKARKVAHAILDENLYTVAATDLHSPRGARDWVGRAIDELQKRAGEPMFDSLMKRNPQKMLDGHAL
ncbi:MAG TPA: CpsB/CapC family capsule biosynthesis tyrosine phosphatase [Myxococcaceae bacterium]|nr:CpsB/CapC family capsule biosynthesis tyrosine phosphatase [Myxococcaceae bacterium]